MVSKARQKGYRTVASGKEILHKKGYISANLEKSGRFAKEKDLFNLWDYIFIKGKTHLFVQFKTNQPESKKIVNKWKKPFIKWGKKHGSKTVRYEIWNKVDYQGFYITKCS